MFDLFAVKVIQLHRGKRSVLLTLGAIETRNTRSAMVASAIQVMPCSFRVNSVSGRRPWLRA
ncbi:hypothetical protein D3C80_1945260 [compost metagenome]